MYIRYSHAKVYHCLHHAACNKLKIIGMHICEFCKLLQLNFTCISLWWGLSCSCDHIPSVYHGNYGMTWGFVPKILILAKTSFFVYQFWYDLWTVFCSHLLTVASDLYFMINAGYQYTADLLALEQCKRSDSIVYDQTMSVIITPLKASAWESHLDPSTSRQAICPVDW